MLPRRPAPQRLGDSVAYLGSGSLPTQAIPSVMVLVAVPVWSA